MRYALCSELPALWLQGWAEEQTLGSERGQPQPAPWCCRQDSGAPSRSLEL